MFHHCIDFKYADLFAESDANKVFCDIPELGKTIRRDIIDYIWPAVAYSEVSGEDCRELFCSSIRHYAYNPKTMSGGKWPPLFLYNDKDGVYYYHLYWQGKHYALCHRFEEAADAERILLTDENGVQLARIIGYVVDSFEGEDDWNKAYDFMMARSSR